jgi:hypothetical protein
MNGEDPTEFDDELRRHFAGALDPQRGRALRAFEELIQTRQQRRRWLIAASIGLVFLAGAAVAFWPAGIGLLLGLAIFRLISLVMTAIPLLKELKST